VELDLTTTRPFKPCPKAGCAKVGCAKAGYAKVGRAKAGYANHYPYNQAVQIMQC